MQRRPGGGEALSPARRRRLLQLVFVFVNLALVEVHLPGPLWVAIGGLFWIGMLGVTVAGSGIVCGTMCWIGALQDIFEPFARSRIRFDGRLGRAVTLLVLVLWMPLGWLLRPELAAHDRMPLEIGLGWERHLFQLGLALVIAASVVVLGKRGICRMLCPFNSIVATIRRALASLRGPARPRLETPPAPLAVPCGAACRGCYRQGDMTPYASRERTLV